jgi:hypothetical protein
MERTMNRENYKNRVSIGKIKKLQAFMIAGLLAIDCVSFSCAFAMTSLARVEPKPKAIHRETCLLSGLNAAQRPMQRYTDSPDVLAGNYMEADRIYRATMTRFGLPVPGYIDARFLRLVGAMESHNGRNAYTKGNSYMGLFGHSPTLAGGKSNFARHEKKILTLLNAAKNDIPILQKCGQVTHATIVDADYFFDPLLQSFFTLTTALEADKELSKLRNYNNDKKMPLGMKQAALYLFHNIPSIAIFAVRHIDSKTSIVELLKHEKHPLQAQLAFYMKNNPTIYSLHLTSAELLTKILKATHKDQEILVRNDATLITG